MLNCVIVKAANEPNICEFQLHHGICGLKDVFHDKNKKWCLTGHFLQIINSITLSSAIPFGAVKTRNVPKQPSLGMYYFKPAFTHMTTT